MSRKNQKQQSVVISDPAYPKLLKIISDPPGVLYYKGSAELLQTPCVSIVGSRKMTSYGRQWVLEVAKELSCAGFTIVSGMALGVDAQAHRGALTGNGKTIACFASSLEENMIGPPRNARLAQDVLDSGGLWLSEYEASTPARSYTFPQRNRIVSGLSHGVVIVESTLQGGTMITARLAREQQRHVFALPGRVDYALSKGPHKLIKTGAHLVESAEDILTILRDTVDIELKSSSIESKNEYGPRHRDVMAFLSDRPLHLNDIAKQSKLPIHQLMQMLTELELDGAIIDTGNKTYKRTSNI